MALVIVIAFMAVLSVIGAILLNITTNDIRTAGHVSPVRKAFYAADRAVEYSMSRDIIVSLSPGEEVNLMTDVAGVYNSVTLNHHDIIDSASAVDGVLVSGTVTDLGPKSLPSSVASFFGSEFGANVYHVAAEAKAGNPSVEKRIDVDTSVVRLFKLDDDTIFRTDGGD